LRLDADGDPYDGHSYHRASAMPLSAPRPVAAASDEDGSSLGLSGSPRLPVRATRRVDWRLTLGRRSRERRTRPLTLRFVGRNRKPARAIRFTRSAGLSVPRPTVVGP